MPVENVKKWLALYTKPKHEFKAALQLEAENVIVYLPTIAVIKQWSDRKKKVTEPLFRSYIFIHADEAERLRALEQNAVVKTIFFDGKPAVIPEWQIDNLKKLLTSNEKIKVFNGIVTGMKVKIESGSFSGIEGVVYNVSKDEQVLAIVIEMLNRSVTVSLPSASVIKVKK